MTTASRNFGSVLTDLTLSASAIRRDCWPSGVYLRRRGGKIRRYDTDTGDVSDWDAPHADLLAFDWTLLG